MASKQDNETLKLLLIAGGGAVVFFTIKKGFTGLLELFGVKDSKNTKLIENEVDNPDSPWQPTYWQKTKGALLKVAYTQSLCKQIYNSVHWWRSDEWSVAFGAIKSCKTKTQISWLAYQFNILYGEDLLSWLPGTIYPNDRYDSDEVAQAVNYVNGLPK